MYTYADMVLYWDCLPVQKSPISHLIFHITCKLIAKNVLFINLIVDHFMKICL